ncbi:glutamine amidotransferase class-I [Strigomonas culicis]|nr:glutamine amidotransferase class-I [Strigomonas culicis]|eukprot:EPY31733.1 glutamine amidotransferase class-I [Strigomonas culicis]
MVPAAEGQPYRIAAVACFGGSMSANDNLPYYEKIFSLIRSCAAHRVPYIGVCLGAQLLSKALGGTVGPSPNVEMGWAALKVVPDTSGEVKPWFGDNDTIDAFMIHGETFSVPEGCHLVVHGQHCANQAIQYRDQYIIGTQFHPEIDTPRGVGLLDMKEPCLYWQREIDAMTPEERATKLSPGAMTRDAIQEGIEAGRLKKDYVVMKKLFDTWAEGFMNH